MATEKMEISLVKQPELYLPAADELKEITEELRGVLTRSMLGTIQIANGGACCFKVKEPGADEATPGVQAIEGVILCSHPTNALWGHDFSHREQGEMPVCRSMDGQRGTILETGEVRMCAECPHNQFVDGHKECTNKKQLYIMREGDLVPILFSLPPTALKYFDKYLVRCRLTMRVPLFSVVTRITLRNETNNGNEFSVPVFTPIGKLPKEEAHRLSVYAQEFAAAAQRSGIQADDLSASEAESPTSAPDQTFVQVPEDEETLPF